MLENKEKKNNELNEFIKERGGRILNQFGKIIFEDVKNTEILTLLNEVKVYWSDCYRPALISLCCEAVEGKKSIADVASLMLTVAAAGVGIHDDVVDKSRRKRFKNTILKSIASDKALLLGDLFIVKGWGITHKMIKETKNSKLVARIIKIYEKSCIKMIEAEFKEISCRKNLETDLDVYKKEVLMKLNADLEACGKIGAIMGNSTEEEILILESLGRNLGYMITIMNEISDMLNIDGNLIHRLRNESIPLPLLHSTKNSPLEIQNRIKSMMEKSIITEEDAKELLLYCLETESFEYIQDEIKLNEQETINNLDKMKPSTAKNILVSMVRDMENNISRLCTYATGLMEK